MPLITKVLKPEQFTAENLLFFAWPTWVNTPLNEADPVTRQAALDAMERALDGCVNAGILRERL